MKLESDGILIAMRPINERDSLAYIFTRDYGVLIGMLRGAVVARKNRPVIGQVGHVTWNARVDSQLGVFHWDIERNLIAPLMGNLGALGRIDSMFALIHTLLPERESYPMLYDATIDAIGHITTGDMVAAYIDWEMCMLREMGYALDLTHCSGCGRHDNLNYISSRTGRAVCDSCAAPYMRFVYRMPIDLEITGRFLEMVCTKQGATIPPARVILSHQN